MAGPARDPRHFGAKPVSFPGMGIALRVPQYVLSDNHTK